MYRCRVVVVKHIFLDAISLIGKVTLKISLTIRKLFMCRVRNRQILNNTDWASQNTFALISIFS